MRKIAATLLILFGVLTSILSQNVDSIKVEQAGELIKVHYKILNSTQSQFFRVTVYCSINGGLQSVIKSLSGDFGDNVVGGRSEYMVLWDVLKDVDEVKSVDFSIRAELVKDNSLAGINRSNRRVHVLAVVEAPAPKLGIKLGYMGSWGVSVSYRVGNNISIASLDLTKRIVNKDKFKLHLYAGIGTVKGKGDELLFGNSVANLSTSLIEGGLIFSINKLSFSVGLSEWKRNDLIDTHVDYPMFGMGLLF